MRIKLQNIIIPEQTKGGKEPLYFNKIGDTVSYSTYFNSFSIVKWKKYTEVKDIKIHLLVAGSCELKVKNFQKCKKNVNADTIAHAILFSQKINNIDPSWVEVNIPEDVTDGIVGFEVKILSDNSKIIDGFYDAEIPDDIYQEVNLALNICTYKREKYVIDNLNIIYSEILNNSESNLRNHIEVYIQDNGHTLNADEFHSEKIHIVNNKNNGGVAGFTRGMLEVMNHIDSFPATHIIIMDDDIELCTESIFRTYSILTCRKKIYQDLTIGGAMLKINDPAMMIENGSTWDSKKIHPNKYELRIDSVSACVECEIEENANYNAWWYCCMPMAFVREDNLPIPVFMQGDDIEYGLRNIGALLVINGVCVWHQAFETKYSSSIYYYKHRNMLIVNALHFKSPGFAYFAKDFLTKVLGQVYSLRYNNARLLIKATEDFLKGIDFIKCTDAEQLHKEIINLSDKLINLDDIQGCDVSGWREVDRKHIKPNCILKKLVSVLTVNGTFLPAIDRSKKGMLTYNILSYNILDIYREKKVLYLEKSTGRGFVAERDGNVAISILFETAVLLVRAALRFRKVNHEYRNRIGEIITEEYWKKYLQL